MRSWFPALFGNPDLNSCESTKQTCLKIILSLKMFAVLCILWTHNYRCKDLSLSLVDPGSLEALYSLRTDLFNIINREYSPLWCDSAPLSLESQIIFLVRWNCSCRFLVIHLLALQHQDHIVTPAGSSQAPCFLCSETRWEQSRVVSQHLSQ